VNNKLNTIDLKQLSAITQTQLGAEVRKLEEAGVGLKAMQYVLAGNNFREQLLLRSLMFLLHKIYGADIETLHNQLRRLVSACAQFAKHYGDGPVSVLRAPARINILGEHIDYVSYLPTESLAFGSREHDMLMLYRRSGTDRVRGASALAKHSQVSFNLDEGPPVSTSGNAEADWLTYLYQHHISSPHWINYVKGAAYFARMKCGPQVSHGFDFVVDSGIPAGSGASSSSALVILASAAVRDVNYVQYTLLELARDGAKAEWYVGTRGGSMDHITICLAKRHHAVLIAYQHQEARQVALPGKEFRWITFFSQAADKGREVMIEYNERAAVSRIVLPALIEERNTKQPALLHQWTSAIQSLQTGTTAALDEIEELLQELPVTLTFAEIAKDYPNAFAACARSFPDLVAERAERPLQVRSLALHHIGEIRRVNKATQVLENLSQPSNNRAAEQDLDAAMHLIGTILDQSHASLRDLYQVSTPDVERLREIIRTCPGVYGARLMGGGFGGNVLALTSKEKVDSLIDHVQAEYYKPQNRQGINEGSVMISTPGEGLAPINVELVWREAIEDFNALGQEATKFRAGINALLDRVSLDESMKEVWPVIVAAGKGTRSRASGLAIPKPLAPILGIPAILHVLRNLRTAFGPTRSPIVIVSLEAATQVRELIKEDVTLVVQPEALGTGDAVLCAHKQMQGFQGQALVIWSTQPVIKPETMVRTLKLSTLFPEYQMVVPTVHKDRPYAPLLRDERGRVESARETHLEQAGQVPFGESNIGMFLLKSEAMFKALVDLNQRYWSETEHRYRRNGGELGFPNELTNYFAARKDGVLACAIADSREEQGIKKLADIALCERYISELAGPQS